VVVVVCAGIVLPDEMAWSCALVSTESDLISLLLLMAF
jgi:hypothetical protein